MGHDRQWNHRKGEKKIQRPAGNERPKKEGCSSVGNRQSPEGRVTKSKCDGDEKNISAKA